MKKLRTEVASSHRALQRIAPPTYAVSQRMRGVRQVNTDCELRIRKALHRGGLRYRVNVIPIRGLRTKPDIVFARQRVAIFIDGCFWHSCPAHGSLPRHNRLWWKAKLAANHVRDQNATTLLQSMGWTVLRFWSHEGVASVVDAIRSAVEAPGVKSTAFRGTTDLS
jgi:DNA mismatch endonuclease, patch repair protein